MHSYLKTIIVRHRRENKKKCTLEPIIERQDCSFYSYPGSILDPVCVLDSIDNYILLGFEGPELSIMDEDKGILLIDGTWKRAEVMQKELFKNCHIEKRSLPKNIYTAYPRRQPDCAEPELGLASIEALYVAYKILGREAEELLKNYYWKENFLAKNKNLLDMHSF